MLLLIDPAQQTVGAADVCAGGYGKLQHLTSLRQISGVVEQLRPLLQGAHEKGVILVVLCQKVDVGRAVAKFQLRIADTCLLNIRYSSSYGLSSDSYRIM